MMLSDDQEITDFRLALKLQQDEFIESPPYNESSSQVCSNQNAECNDDEAQNTAATALLSLQNHASGKQ